MSITISDTYLNEIKKPLAYPTVAKVILTDDQIKDLCVAPALREYFTKFPKKEVYSQSIVYSDPVEIDFPDDYTFGVVDMRIVDKLSNDSANTGNFWELASFNKYGLSSKKEMYGIEGYNPNSLRQQKITEMQAERALRDNVEAIKLKVDVDNRIVIAHTNQSAVLLIEWAKYSDDFSDVKFQRINDVIKLSSAYLLEHLADTTGMVNNTSLDVEVNSDALQSKASEYRSEIKEKWDQFPDIILMNI